MSSFPDAHKVYELAAVFRERVIEQGKSFLWPDREIWTVENARGAHDLLMKEWESGVNDYSVAAQILASHSDEYLMVGADVISAVLLFTQVGRKTQEPKIQSFLGAGDIPNPDEETYSRLMEQTAIPFPGSGNYYPDSWQKQFMSVLYGIVLILEHDLTSGPLNDVVDLISAELAGHSFYWDLHMWGFLHALYPDEIPNAGGKGNRERLVRQYAAVLEGREFNNEFEKLNAIRESLNHEANDLHFDFYEPELRLEWDDYYRKNLARTRSNASPFVSDQESVSHIVADRAPVYEVARVFRSNVMEEGRSLLWPDEEVWTDEAVQAFLERFKNIPVEKGISWLQMFAKQFENSDPTSAKILADSYALIMQFVSTGDYKGETKSRILNEIISWVDTLPGKDVVDQVDAAFLLGIGSVGTAFLQAISHQLAFLPAFVSVWRANKDSDLRAVMDEAQGLAKSTLDFRKTTIPARNILLHLLEPQHYERIASRDHKVRIVDNFSAQLDALELESEDLDDNLSAVRAALANTYFPADFDFYDAEVSGYWQGDQILETPGTIVDPPIPTPAPTIDDLAAATFLQPDFLRDIESLLKSRKQLIFEGPPGSGKTFVAEKFARYFTGQSLTEKRNETIELVQFHQSYSYEDFMEGIRPETIDGQLHYNVKPGIFRRFAERASKNPDQKFVMIIDEINRGNVSRILGELMLLLEYRNETATLPYSQEPFEIPGNLYIIGTMNSADRSLSQIDYALRRRFYFLRFLAVEGNEAPVLSGWLQQQGFEVETQRRILETFIKLNQQLRTHLETDDMQVGHSYFMHPQIHEEKFRTNVWKYAVIPLIREYLYHHRDRDELLIGYEYESMRAIVQPIAEETNIPEDELTQGTSSEAEMP